MTRKELADMSENYLRELLASRLPSHTPVYLYGSRARGDARWSSDYDLWIDADIPSQLIGEIKEIIDESFVPFNVDIVVTSQLKSRFEEQVRKEAKPWM